MAGKKGEPSQGSARKRVDPIVFERDLAILLEGRCALKPMAQILDELNSVREAEARKTAEERGLPPEAVEEFARHSRLSVQTAYGDIKRLRSRMAQANMSQGKDILRRQYERLEVLRQSFVVLERRAWQELERSSASTSSSVSEVVEIDVTPEEQQAVENLGVRDTRAFSTVLRPKSRRVDQPAAADPRWFAVISELLSRQVQLAEKMFELEALLGMEAPPDFAALSALAPEDARDGLADHDLRMLYSPEARAAKLDPGAFAARFKLLDAWLAGKARRGAGGEEEGGSGFRVIGLDAEPKPS